MKPKDLKAPFSWEERRPLILDHILYVPNYYEAHDAFAFPAWESVFGRLAPVEVEYCSGNGAWIIEQALKYPDRNWVAVEIQFERVRKIWSKLKNYQLSNLLIVCGDARTFNAYYAPQNGFAAAYVNFPDPWPKDKHEKNRLLTPSFFSKLSTLCQEKATLTIVTDHKEYGMSAIGHLQDSKVWRSIHPFPYYTLDGKDYGTSYFDALFRQQGLTIHYIQYERVL
ncbi:MAG: tRNA (guanine-N7)-methyltransferase [Chlamydiota bacterium]|jgi:tRNA (guanine-N7-)-methyltransferase